MLWTLKASNLQIIISNEQEGMDKENTIVKEQTPKAGIKVKQESNIYIDGKKCLKYRKICKRKY